ncbi:hypothetical protein GGR55DRAFT_682895 [Xylaria sp. FL0064]|nr:hypothetical protein GGR55DRAFT_682895 [Xylaria sp. FL0064]
MHLCKYQHVWPLIVKDIPEADMNINAVGKRCGTTLHAAAFRHDLDAVQLLLNNVLIRLVKNGADVKVRRREYGHVYPRGV